MDTEGIPRNNTDPNNVVYNLDESCDSDFYLRSRSRVLLDELKEIFAKCEQKCSVCDKYLDKLYGHFKQTHAPVPVTTDIRNDGSESTQGITVEKALKLDLDDIDIEQTEDDSLSVHGILVPETSIVDGKIPGISDEFSQPRTSHKRETRKTRKSSFRVPVSMIEHRESTHSIKKQAKMKVVQKKKDSKKSQLKTHTGEKQYSCESCDKHFTNRQGLTRHELIHSGERPHSCQHCGKCFNNKHRLRHHIMTHTGEKPYVCQQCGKKFGDKSGLNRHTRTHSVRTLHPCEYCGKQFKDKVNLNRHAKTHTGETPLFSCELCGKGCRDARIFERHTRTHTGEKPYLCQTCGKSFIDNSALTLHEIIHTGEKPHTCESCGKGFNDLRNLRRHRLTHTGEKSFLCQTCGKDFTGQQALTHHTRIHTGEKPYSCESCGKRFSIKTVFNRHSCISIPE